jgi:hypothetical protein
MSWRLLKAWVLLLPAACATAPPPVPRYADPYEAELNAARYELKVLTAGMVDTRPVEVSAEEFRQALQKLTREVRPSELPRETARLLLEEPLQADLLMEVEAGRVVRMVPLEEDSPLPAASHAALLAWYRSLCAERYGGGSDCLGLTADGPILDREDRRTLALAWAFDGVLAQTGRSLREMASPQAVFGLLVGMAVLYFALWLVPEPVTKGLAALMTLAFIAWLGVDTVWSLMKGWGQLAHAADRATTAEELQEAGRTFSRVMGDNTARVVMLVLTAAVGGGRRASH